MWASSADPQKERQPLLGGLRNQCKIPWVSVAIALCIALSGFGVYIFHHHSNGTKPASGHASGLPRVVNPVESPIGKQVVTVDHAKRESLVKPSGPQVGGQVATADDEKRGSTVNPSLRKAIDNSPVIKPQPSCCRNGTSIEEYRAKLLAGCGQICDISQVTTDPRQFLKKAVNCPALFQNKDADAPANVWPPPKAPPPEFYEDFTMNGAVPVTQWYIQERLAGTTGAHGQPEKNGWTKAGIEQKVSQAKAGTLEGAYGHGDTSRIQQLIAKHSADFVGKHVVVVGSLDPWVEAILLAAGVANVTTVEYGKLPRHPHPQVTTMTPAELAAKLETGLLQPFDAAASYSSLEHSGLGRYGDTVNPWGDLQAAAKIWCVLKADAAFLMGTMDGNGADQIVWNAHRIYGSRRWPHLMANFRHVETLGSGSIQTASLYRKSP